MKCLGFLLRIQKYLTEMKPSGIQKSGISPERREDIKYRDGYYNYGDVDPAYFSGLLMSSPS